MSGQSVSYIHANFAVTVACQEISFAGRISDAHDWKRVHEQREAADGVLVGRNTFLQDRPNLWPRAEYLGRSPTSLPNRYILSADINFQAPLGYQAIVCTDNDLSLMLTKLAATGVSRLLVEGGLKVHNSLLSQHLVTIFTCFILTENISEAVKMILTLLPGLAEAKTISTEPLGIGFLFTAKFADLC